MTDDSRFIVLTGISRGLGNSLFQTLVERGHTLAGCARNEASIQDMRKEYHSDHSLHTVDVSDVEQVDRWAKEILERHGPPDLLINNAAVINENNPLWQVPVAEFSQLVDVNIKGIFHTIRAFLPAMLEAQRGIVVNLSSGWGRSTAADVAPYCATKWAVEGLTQSLAHELPSEMAAVPLNPGIIDTEMLRSCFGAGAACYPGPEAWSEKAANMLLDLSAKDNGRPLTV
ncbi:MAG: SDR family NAD(P)-dependent oxidoreductase [Planctomycetaceae bacterium]|nr:SDR family NAD(P)-dependent oxidoreductase [Planctomycetaceae bacterium]